MPKVTSRLPRSAPPSTSSGESSPSELAAAGLRILLVEDHEDTRLIFKIMLAQNGHFVETAASGGEALTLAGQQPFDLVISDLGLPDFSGIELMNILRERYSLRGVAVSGYGMDEDIQRSKAAGFDYHVTKPADPAKIQRLLADVMRETRPSPAMKSGTDGALEAETAERASSLGGLESRKC